MYTLAIATAGEHTNPPLLMLHGWNSYNGVWRSSMDALQDHFYCVAIDLLGFGRSDKPPHANYSIQAQGRRVLAEADRRGYTHFALAGHSMGAQIALWMAANLCPSRVDFVVSVAGPVMPSLTRFSNCAVLPTVLLLSALPDLMRVGWRLAHRRWFAWTALSWWFFHVREMPFDAWAEDREMALLPDIVPAMCAAARAIYSLDLVPDLPAIHAPVLAIAGQQDAAVPAHHSQVIHAQVPHSKLLLLERCGHFPMYEQPTAYLAALRRFALQTKPPHEAVAS